MSRCFPFPPPGYEKKPTTDEPDLLKKEKRKEKKHKKDKKDKEKRDGKEKSEKDRSEGKHKEKKDKKDKHRDKKEKKSKSSNPDEKKAYGQFEGYNGEKVHPNDSTRSSSSSDKKQFQNGEYHEHLQKKDESKNGSSDDKKSSMQFCGQNGELVRNRSKATTGTSENNKFVQELDRRIRDEEKGIGSHQFAFDGRKNSFNRIEIQKTDGRQSIMDGAGISRISNSTVQNKINGKTLPPFDNKIEKRVEQKEKMPEKESDDKRGDKRKNKDRDKQRQGKDKDTEKEKKEEKAKEKSEQKRAEREKNKYIRKSESIPVPVPVPVPNNFSARPLENSFHGIGSEGNFKKRKDMESNGVSHETEPRPNKMGRFSSNISPENGRKLDSVQNPGLSLLDNRQGASQGASMNNFKVGSKGQRVNGMIDPQPASVSSKTPPFSAFNHIPAKPSPIKSPPVITNHVAPQPPPVPTTKPQPVLPNHITPQPPTPKPPPLIPNHISARSPPLSSTPPPSTTAKQPMSRPKPPPAVIKPPAPAPLPLPKKKPEPLMKPPHPDTKYLNQILSVPKLDQWSGFDDQEWLFSKKDDYPCSKKTTTEEHQVQVWSEAKHIESVDVCALPYVIPY